VQLLAKEGLAAAQVEEDARRDLMVADKTLIGAHSQLDNLKATKESLKEGITLVDFSSTDRTYSSQRVDEVRLRLAQLSGDLAVKKAERAAVTAQLNAEQDYVASQSENRIRVAQRSRVWKLQAASGEFVSRGQPLFQLVDCTRPKVVAYLNERNYDRVRVGDPVTMRLAGRSDHFRGRVDLLLGGPDNLLGSERAMSLAPELRERFAVAISSPALTAELSSSCETGQNAEVEFTIGRR